MNQATGQQVLFPSLNDGWEISYGLSDFVRAIRHYAGWYAVGGPEDDLQDEIKERTVRHYQALGVIDRPEKEGREVRYTKRHLLQMLAALKARASTGISPRALSGHLVRMTDEALMEMLVHGVQVSFSRPQTDALLEPQVNAGALDRLAGLAGEGTAKPEWYREIESSGRRASASRVAMELRHEAGARSAGIRAGVQDAFSMESEGQSPGIRADLWSRYRFSPGVELHVRGDLEESTIETLVGAIGRVLLPCHR